MFQPSSSGRFRGVPQKSPKFWIQKFWVWNQSHQAKLTVFFKIGNSGIGGGWRSRPCTFFFETTKLAWLKTEAFLENAGLNLKNNTDDCSIVLPKIRPMHVKSQPFKNKIAATNKEQKQGMLCSSNKEVATSVKGLTEAASFWRINAITCSPFTAGKGHCITLKITSNTLWKINMEPTNHPCRKENDLPNLHDYVPC